ncbi:MAG TPA: lipid-transfer protein [Actinomycetota bacterium]
MIRPVHVVASAITDLRAPTPEVTTAEMAFDVARAAVERSGLPRGSIGVTVSASSDMLEGRSFNFVRGLEALGAHPAVHERHLEMDGAWAAYYAWLLIQTGEFDGALVVAWGKTSEGSTARVLNTRLDPFVLAPLGLDDVACAGLQADAFVARAGLGVESIDEVAARAGRAPSDEIVASPLTRAHLPDLVDGACALVLSAGGEGPVIRGADHRIEPGALGHRDLSRAVSARAAAERARAMAGWDTRVDLAEVGSSYAHQELMLREALALDGERVNPSGGPMVADPIMATGLIRLAEAAARAGPGERALAHAATGPAMQQNVVWLLEGAA